MFRANWSWMNIVRTYPLLIPAFSTFFQLSTDQMSFPGLSTLRHKTLFPRLSFPVIPNMNPQYSFAITQWECKIKVNVLKMFPLLHYYFEGLFWALERFPVWVLKSKRDKKVTATTAAATTKCRSTHIWQSSSSSSLLFSWSYATMSGLIASP